MSDNIEIKTELDALRQRCAWAERNCRSAEATNRFWLRAARKAIAGDMRELRNRVDLADAPFVPVALSGTREPSQL